MCFLLSIVCCSEAFAVVFDDSTYNTLDKINLDTISKKEMSIIFGLAKRESDNEKKQLLLKITAAGLLSIGEKKIYNEKLRSFVEERDEFENAMMEICSKCGGQDLKEACGNCRGGRRCPRCGGGGVERFPQVGGGYITSRCYKCNGNGRCRQCDGSGRQPSNCSQCKGQKRYFTYEQAKLVCVTLVKGILKEKEDRELAAKEAERAAREAEAERLAREEEERLAREEEERAAREAEAERLAREEEERLAREEEERAAREEEAERAAREAEIAERNRKGYKIYGKRAFEKRLIYSQKKDLRDECFKVIQVLEEGKALCVFRAFNRGYGWVDTDIVFLLIYPKDGNETVVDGDVFTNDLYWGGTYSYTTVRDANKKVNVYCINFDTATKRLHNQGLLD